MKKLIALLLAVLMIAGLCACKEAGSSDPDTNVTTDAPEALPTESQDEIPSEDETESVPQEVLNANMSIAEGFIGKSVEELYQAIGEPESADYAPSCLNPGVGEDGNLYYDGFVVYTYREGDTETIEYVEEAE